jgi:hypothetical protein
MGRVLNVVSGHKTLRVSCSLRGHDLQERTPRRASPSGGESWTGGRISPISSSRTSFILEYRINQLGRVLDFSIFRLHLSLVSSNI